METELSDENDEPVRSEINRKMTFPERYQQVFRDGWWELHVGRRVVACSREKYPHASEQ